MLRDRPPPPPEPLLKRRFRRVPRGSAGMVCHHSFIFFFVLMKLLCSNRHLLRPQQLQLLKRRQTFSSIAPLLVFCIALCQLSLFFLFGEAKDFGHSGDDGIGHGSNAMRGDLFDSSDTYSNRQSGSLAYVCMLMWLLVSVFSFSVFCCPSVFCSSLATSALLLSCGGSGGGNGVSLYFACAPPADGDSALQFSFSH